VPIWVFLVPDRFAAKTPAYEGWISLDFLGFSRLKRDLSMGYAGFSLEDVSVWFFPKSDAPERKPVVLACGNATLLMAELNPISDFPQPIALRADPVWSPR
jgi:hypothetical protein